MEQDPVILEIRQIRQNLAEKFHHDFDEIFADLKRLSDELETVVLPPKRVEVEEDALAVTQK